jgi:TetR/AcrR family tetracycline transcriptional repressor
MFDGLARHRNVAPLLAREVPTGPNAMVAREKMIALLLANGFPPSLAARSHATLARYVLGFAIQLTGNDNEQDDDALTQVFHDLDPAQFPATVAVADNLPVAWDDEFAFGLELIVDGLTQTLERHRQPAKGKRKHRGTERNDSVGRG